MSGFGNTLFSGSRFIFWALSPFLLLFCILMPLTVQHWDAKAFLITACVEIPAILLLIGLYDSRRFDWALRSLAILVFLAYAVYFIDEAFILRAPFRLIESRAGASPRNALLGLIFIGLPCL